MNPCTVHYALCVGNFCVNGLCECKGGVEREVVSRVWEVGGTWLCMGSCILGEVPGTLVRVVGIRDASRLTGYELVRDIVIILAFVNRSIDFLIQVLMIMP